MKLYELTNAFTDLVELLENEEVEQDTIRDTLEAIESSIEEKAENIAKILNAYDGDIDLIKAEEKRLADKRKVIENKKDSLKDYLKSTLENAEIKNVKTLLFNISIRNNPPSVSIIDESLIPHEYITTKEVTSISKRDIIEQLKLGVEVPGVEMKQGTSLSIK